MKISVILAHPDRTSFNHAIAAEVVAVAHGTGHDVRLHDLYDEKFEPVMPTAELQRESVLPEQIEGHCREIAEADGIVVVHPNWWGQPPAILKGWVDRVIRPGIAYRFEEGDGGEGVPRGLLRTRVALVFNTSNTPADRERAVFGDPLETLWRNCIFGLCGVPVVQRRMFSVVVTSSSARRAEWLAEVREAVKSHFPAE